MTEEAKLKKLAKLTQMTQTEQMAQKKNIEVIEIGDTVKITNQASMGSGKIGIVERLGTTIGVWVRVGDDKGLYYVPFGYEKVVGEKTHNG